MQHELEVRILKQLMGQLEQGTTADAGVQCRQPMGDYVDPELAQREWNTFFQNHPQIIGLSGDLPDPHSFLTLDDFGVPVLATRDSNGQFRAFVNACRHRGVQVASAGRGTSKRFICPFHAWSYSSSGELTAVAQAAQFGAVDKACNGLIELPAMEKYGFLWVHPQPNGKIDPDQLLGGFSGELADGAYDRFVFRGEMTIEKRLNWKIANDTFGETYHFKTLHKNTLAQIFHGDNLSYESRGRNHRFAFARKDIEMLRSIPEANWFLLAGATLLYYLFPNIQLIEGAGRVTLVKIYPHPTDPGRSISRIISYFTQEMLDQLEAAQQDASMQMITAENVYQPGFNAGVAMSPEAIMEVFNSTIELEDYAMGESQQRAAENGLLQYMIFGRNEPALQHYHNTFRAALDLPPLEIVETG